MMQKTYKLTNYANHIYTVILFLTKSRGSIVGIATAQCPTAQGLEFKSVG
jgi:hypothetical protein